MFETAVEIVLVVGAIGFGAAALALWVKHRVESGSWL